MNDIYSFYQLISKYQIEIPIIQRDYAQGRNNAKAADVRKFLVEKMIKAVEKENESLFFDFVYGRVDGNKFIPFDGQQRLTTLFLFHKYVFEKCQSKSMCGYKGNCICKGILGRFSYATRQSSREFCEKMVKENVIPSDDNKVSENIKNQSWFYPDWQKDPTVMGMLTMLDEIHNQMKTIENFKTIAEKLTSGCNCPITFYFVDMGEHKLSDETYVKMNARGKQLTPFENFKASLEQYLEEKKNTDTETQEICKKLLNSLKGKIDGTWLDLFWRITNSNKHNNEEKELPDSLMMSFFNRHFMNVWRCWYANNPKPDDLEDKFNDRIQKEMPLCPTKDDFVSFEIYSYVMDKCGINDCLTPIFNICDALCVPNNSIENDCQAVWNREHDGDKERWDLFHKDTKDETYKSRAAFYALLKYYEKEQERNGTSLAQCMRVVWNIIENYVEREDSYISALRLIADIADNSFDITRTKEKTIAKDQVEEEINKARKIVDSSWKAKIVEAEKYAFFKGAIRFLFTKDKIGDDWNDFDTKWENAQKYFDGNGVKEEKSATLLRALLSRIDISEQWFGNYKEFWHDVLLNNDYSSVIHELLEDKKGEVIKSKCAEEWLKNDQLLWELLKNCNYKNWHILKNWNGYSVLTRYSRREQNPRSPKEIVVLNTHRNKMLENFDIDKDCRVGNTGFLYGWNINFKYNDKNFQWADDDKVYLMSKEDPNVEMHPEKALDAKGIKDQEEFKRKLDTLGQDQH